MPDFVQTAVKEIDDQLRALKDEAARLEAARDALTGGRRRPGRRSPNANGRTPARRASRTNGRAPAAPPRRGGDTRAKQALELVREKPGITIAEIAKAMNIQPNYLYRVLPRLASDGQVKRDGQGWRPASSSTSSASPSRSTPPSRSDRLRNVTGPGQNRAAKAKATASLPGAAETRTDAESASDNNGHTARGATTASVLAALAGGEAMTAGQVATKAGLARPTVSTTLSKLAKTGRVQKVERGYRLISAA